MTDGVTSPKKWPHNSSIMSRFEPATPFRKRSQLIKVKIQRGRGSSASIMAKHISLGVGLVVNCKPPALTMGTRHTSPGLSIQLQLPVYPAYSILHCHIDIAFWLMGWDLNQYLLFNLPPPLPPVLSITTTYCLCSSKHILKLKSLAEMFPLTYIDIWSSVSACPGIDNSSLQRGKF